MRLFLTRVGEGNKVLSISIVFPDVEHQVPPPFIKN